jgi:hypothetical protein
VLVGGAYLIRTCAKAHPERQFASSDEFVQWLANEAVKEAWEQDHIKTGSQRRVHQKRRADSGRPARSITKDPSTISVKGRGVQGTSVRLFGEANQAHWQRVPRFAKPFLRS